MLTRHWLSALTQRLSSPAPRRVRRRRPSTPAVAEVEALEDRAMLANFVVDTLVDENNGAGSGAGTSLREAIAAANANDEADIITFSVNGTILLTIADASNDLLPTITDDLVIDGGTLGDVVIDTNLQSRIVSANTDGIVTFRNLEFRDGDDIDSGSDGGTAIKKRGSGRLVIQNSRFIGQDSDGEGKSLRIDNGSALVVDTVFDGTGADFSGSGLVFNAAGTSLTIVGGAIQNGDVGGLLSDGYTVVDGTRIQNLLSGTAAEAPLSNRAGTLIVRNAQILLNINTNSTAGIRNATGATLQVSDTLIAGNTSDNDGAGIENFGHATINDTVITGNRTTGVGDDGGGIANRGVLIVNGGALVDNEANSGGGLVNFATATLNGVDVSANTARDDGGGIHNVFLYTSLEIIGGTISGNHAADKGGGVSNNVDAHLNATNVRISGNTAMDGAGLANFGSLAEAKLVNVDVIDNVASNNGGGLWNDGSSTTLDVSGGTIRGNEANAALGDTNGGGGLYNADGTVHVTNATIDDNNAVSRGGGVYTTGGMVTIETSTISRNGANHGAGVTAAGAAATLNLRTSTVSGNTATGFGGGIDNSGGDATINIVGSTITANTASTSGGVENHVNATSTIVAGNSASFLPDVLGSNIHGDNHLIGDTFNSLPNGTNNILNVNPVLGPLQNNGGPTETHALLPGSPALGNGIDVTPLGLDQRGEARPQGNGVDIGAFESDLSPVQLLALRDGNQLVQFPDNNPADVTTRNITGLLPNEEALTLDSRQADGKVYLLTNQSNLYTVDPATGIATFVNGLTQGLDDGLAAQIDEERNLNFSTRGLFENAAGLGEKWLIGTNAAGTANLFYLLLPNGNLHEFASSGLGTLVASFGTNVFENPALLVNAFDGLGSLTAQEQEDIEDADFQNRFYRTTRAIVPAEFFRNSLGLGEVWIRGDDTDFGTGTPWFVILPNGNVHKMANGSNLGALVASLHPIVNEDPTILTTAYDKIVGPIVGAEALDEARNFFFASKGQLFEDALGRKEKHFLGTDANGAGIQDYFIEPDGDLFALNAPNTLIANLGGDAYDALDRVVNAHDPFADLGAGTRENFARIDFEHGLYRATDNSRDRNSPSTDSGYYFNSAGQQEKWLRGKINEFGNPWYQITTNGDVFAWNGTSTVGGTLLVNGGTAVYVNPQILYKAYDRMATLGDGILGDSKVEIDFDNDAGTDFLLPGEVDSLGLLVDNGTSSFARIDVRTGEVLDEPAFADIASVITALAFDGNGPGLGTGNAFVVDADNTNLNTLNETTGALTPVGALPTVGVEAGLDVVTVDDIERTYYVRSGGEGTDASLFLVDKATGTGPALGANNGLIGTAGQFGDILDITALLN